MIIKAVDNLMKWGDMVTTPKIQFTMRLDFSPHLIEDIALHISYNMQLICVR